MQELKKGRNEFGKLEKGKPFSIGLNRLVDFKIITTGGTIIEGKIPANEYLKVTSGGDLSAFEIVINDLPKDLKVAD